MSPCDLREKSSCIWISKKEEALKLKTLLKAHCVSARHRSKDTTKNMVRSEFHWSQLEKGVEEFVQNCLHCIIATSEERIPRPLATALYGQHPTEVIHLDFLYMRPAIDSNLKYVFILKDALTFCSWLRLIEIPEVRQL